MACALTAGTRDLPGGLVHETGHWRVEHCVGPLGAGTLVVKPKRHVLAVADLTDDEVGELGPLLRDVSGAVGGACGADQVYNCLWSHAGGVPVHIHYVIQPVTGSQVRQHGVGGPSLQAAMFAEDRRPDRAEVERIVGELRTRLSDGP